MPCMFKLGRTLLCPFTSDLILVSSIVFYGILTPISCCHFTPIYGLEILGVHISLCALNSAKAKSLLFRAYAKLSSCFSNR